MPQIQGAVSWERVGDVTIVHFNVGRITDIDFCRQASAELLNLADEIGGKMLFSLKNVDFLASVGVSVLVEFNHRIKAANGKLKICDVQPFVWDIFRSIELHRAIDLYQTRGEAMAAFNMGQ